MNLCLCQGGLTGCTFRESLLGGEIAPSDEERELSRMARLSSSTG